MVTNITFRMQCTHHWQQLFSDIKTIMMIIMIAKREWRDSDEEDEKDNDDNDKTNNNNDNINDTYNNNNKNNKILISLAPYTAKIILGNSSVLIISSGLSSISLISGFHNYRFEAALNTEPPFAYQNLWQNRLCNELPSSQRDWQRVCDGDNSIWL